MVHDENVFSWFIGYDEGFNLVFKLLPGNQLIHSTEEEFFASFAAFAGKFGVGERELVHDRLES